MQKQFRPIIAMYNRTIKDKINIFESLPHEPLNAAIPT